MNRDNRLHIAALLILASLALAGCGASKVSKVETLEQPSRIPVEEVEQPDTPVAACNVIDSSMMSAGSMVYVDSAGYARNEALRLKIHKLSSQFESNKDYYIQFFRWKAEGSMSPQIDSTPLEFVFEFSSNRLRIKGTANALDWATLREVAAGVGLQATSADYLLGKLELVLNLKDPTADYDAIKVVAYEHNPATNTSTKVAELDSLIPAYHADPYQYAKKEWSDLRPWVLLKAHPFFKDLGVTQPSALVDRLHALDLELEEDPAKVKTRSDYYKTQARNLCWTSIF